MDATSSVCEVPAATPGTADGVPAMTPPSVPKSPVMATSFKIPPTLPANPKPIMNTGDVSDNGPEESATTRAERLFAELALDLALHTSLSLQNSHSAYMTFRPPSLASLRRNFQRAKHPTTADASATATEDAKGPTYMPPEDIAHPLILPSILDRVFRHLLAANSLHRCLFVCREWHAQATIVLWEAPTFTSLERYVAFSRSFIDLADAADCWRWHMYWRLATLKDRGALALLAALSGDAKMLAQEVWKLLSEDDDPIRQADGLGQASYLDEFAPSAGSPSLTLPSPENAEASSSTSESSPLPSSSEEEPSTSTDVALASPAPTATWNGWLAGVVEDGQNLAAAAALAVATTSSNIVSNLAPSAVNTNATPAAALPSPPPGITFKKFRLMPESTRWPWPVRWVASASLKAVKTAVAAGSGTLAAATAATTPTPSDDELLGSDATTLDSTPWAAPTPPPQPPTPASPRASPAATPTPTTPRPPTLLSTAYDTVLTPLRVARATATRACARAARLSAAAQSFRDRLYATLGRHHPFQIHLLFSRPYLPRFDNPPGALVRELRLHRVRDLTLGLLLPVLRSCPGLERLDLLACDGVGDEVVATVAKVAKRLGWLGTAGCAGVTDRAARTVARMCPGLETWDARSCPRITDEGVEAVAAGCPRLAHVNLGRTNAGERITDRTMVALAGVEGLRCVGVTGCAVGDAGVLALFGGAVEGPWKGASGAVGAVAPAAEAGSPVRRAGAQRVLRRRPNLRILALNFCPITDVAIEAIVECCPSLRVLEVRGCHLEKMQPLADLSLRGVRLECSPELKKRLYDFMGGEVVGGVFVPATAEAPAVEATST
ncbi:hypothetical protein HDU96_010136 [Phlyctochytrium bullatum]|nr:hypothetical protein HDU96_010136 [Phlyctochytrium bullatum]